MRYVPSIVPSNVSSIQEPFHLLTCPAECVTRSGRRLPLPFRSIVPRIGSKLASARREPSRTSLGDPADSLTCRPVRQRFPDAVPHSTHLAVRRDELKIRSVILIC